MFFKSVAPCQIHSANHLRLLRNMASSEILMKANGLVHSLKAKTRHHIIADVHGAPNASLKDYYVHMPQARKEVIVAG